MKYLNIAPWRVWLWMFNKNYSSRRIGIFKNLPHIKPGRWGFYFFGFDSEVVIRKTK